CDPVQSLEETPVIIAELHSLLPTLALTVKALNPVLRLAYVMPDGASLPIGLSRHVRLLREANIIDATVTSGHAWGGDLESVNIYTGLLSAKQIAQADVIICALGPGVVGTGTVLGFSGMQLAETIHAVSLLHGMPIFVPRISFSDHRQRHHGISHHTRTLLRRFTLRPVCLPIPFFGDNRDQVLEDQEAEDRLGQQHHRLLFHAPDLSQVASLHRRY
ncbi:DUF3866 family protein, partial [Microbacteriaceae bacterium K1510]|nr:DUF3866 family protein [Microbacteriaceae bacterium K1510]